MARKPRAFEPNAYYHITAMGNDGRALYRRSGDALEFLGRFGQAVTRYAWRCLTYCLMTNHYHLLLVAPENPEAFPRGFKELNGSYSRATNRRYGREHHLFKNRYGAKHIETDSHLLATARYIVLNPVRAGIVDHPSKWPWSSYGFCANDALAPPFLARDELLRLFDRDATRAREAFKRFVEEGLAELLRERRACGR